jgi:hypothetical protein
VFIWRFLFRANLHFSSLPYTSILGICIIHLLLSFAPGHNE